MAVHGGLRREATPAASGAKVRFSPEMGIDMIYSKLKRKKEKRKAIEF